jgi:hypothetical protein
MTGLRIVAALLAAALLAAAAPLAANAGYRTPPPCSTC